PVYLIFTLKTPTTPDTSPLSLHDALPICAPQVEARGPAVADPSHHVVRRHQVAARDTEEAHRVAVLLERRIHVSEPHRAPVRCQDRKSTRLNSSHDQISYAVFCLKKKKHK